MSTAELNNDIVGRDVFDARGERLGRLDSLYRDRDNVAVCFGAVAMLRRGRRRLVYMPLVDATIAPDSVTLRCGAELARRAPQTRPGQRLPADAELGLYNHFDIPFRPTPTPGRRLQRCS